MHAKHYWSVNGSEPLLTQGFHHADTFNVLLTMDVSGNDNFFSLVSRPWGVNHRVSRPCIFVPPFSTV